MTTTVLAYFPSPAQGVWYLGPFPVRAYALCIIAGIIAALIIGDRRWVARGGERGVIYDIALWAVPFGLIGGRLYHVMTDWKTYFGPGGAGIGAAARIWEGGLGIWGAVALGAVGAWIGCRRKGIPLPAFGDAVAPGIVLAQAIGRVGNYFNQELYGRETTVPWGMEVFYRRDSSGVVDVHSLDGVSTGQVAAVVHPTFLYELLWNLLVFVFLLWADRKFRLGHGRLFALYVAAYCVGRFGIELLRDDTATHIAGIRINVFTSAFVFIGAVLYLLLAPKGREDPEELRGWEPEEDEEEESVADEWADDLVAAAKGSGLLAAATVAGEHEAEDSAAVGDLAGAGATAEFVTPDDGVEVITVGDTEVIPAVADEGTEPETETEEVEAEVVVAETEVAETEVAETEVAETEVAETEVAETEVAEAEAEVDAEVEAEAEAVDEVEAAAAIEAEVDEDRAEVVETEVVETEVVETEVVETEADVQPGAVAELAETESVDEAEVVVAEAEPVVVSGAEPTDDTLVVVSDDSVETNADDTVVVYETTDEPDETDTVVVYQASDETAGAEATVILDNEEAVVVADVTEAVVVENAAEAVIGGDVDTELSMVDADALLAEHVTAEAESVVDADGSQPEAEPAPEAAAVVVVEESQPAPEPEAQAEAQPEQKAQPAAPKPASTAPVTPDPNGVTEEPKLGSTLKRLLWGAGNRGGK